MVKHRSTAFLLALVFALAAFVAPVAAQPPPERSADAETTMEWAPVDTATIHPGVQVFTEAGQCTANFVYTAGTDVFIGMAAHCAALGAPSDTNGCLTEVLPVDSEVEIAGADHPGRLAYSSWLTMQEADETDLYTCQFNDLALVRINPADHDKVNPTLPYWGGPAELDSDGSEPFEEVFSYGNSMLRVGLTELAPKRGWSLGDWAEGWSHDVYTVTPGVPGDSGSAVLAADGTALGVLSSLALAPSAGSNGVSDLSRMLDYLDEHTSIEVELATGTEAFTPHLLPLALG